MKAKDKNRARIMALKEHLQEAVTLMDNITNDYNDDVFEELKKKRKAE